MRGAVLFLQKIFVFRLESAYSTAFIVHVLCIMPVKKDVKPTKEQNRYSRCGSGVHLCLAPPFSHLIRQSACP